MNKLKYFAILILVLTGIREEPVRGDAKPADSGSAPEPIMDLDQNFLSSDLRVPWGDDPFRRVAGYAHVVRTEPHFELGGIVFGKAESVAIVNGETVMVGDEIDGRVVDSIGKNFVVLRKGDSLKELVLSPEEDE